MKVKKEIYVVTNVELGWDCVVGVYEDKEEAQKKVDSGEQYILHEEYLIEKSNENK